MKIALITDLHYGIRSDSAIFHDYYKKFNDFFLAELKERNITNIIMLGDLFDRRKYVNFITAKRCREDFLEPIFKGGYHVDIIAGNHDVYYKNTNTVNSLHELLKPYNFEVYIDPVEKEYDRTKILLLPWITDDNYDRSLKAIEDTKAQICFGHLELEGFEVTKGIVIDKGMSHKIFTKFDLVASGHYHHRSVKDNIHYIGAAYEQSWSDYSDDKGFSIFDTETRTLEFILNPNRIFHMIAYDDVKSLDKIENQVNSGDFSRFRDSYVKVVIGNKNDPYLFDLFIDKINQAGPIEVALVEDISVYQDNDPEGEIDQAEDTIVILNKYVDGLTLKLDSLKMKTMIQSIYNEALDMENSIAEI